MTLTWRHAGLSQVIKFNDDVVTHVIRHQQDKLGSPEAGGQLFGTILDDTVWVTHVSGPYVTDEQGRRYYRSDPAAAARTIGKYESMGLHYLGEWHTHAEDRPVPSGADIEAMLTLIRKSMLTANAAMLLIVGRLPTPSGLSLSTFNKGRFQSWSFETARPRSLVEKFRKLMS